MLSALFQRRELLHFMVDLCSQRYFTHEESQVFNF